MMDFKYFKKFAIYVLVAVFLLTLGLYVYGSKAQEKYPEYSSYNTKEKGAKAVYLLSEQMGYSVSRFERPARLLPEKATLIALKPDTDIFTDDMEIKYLSEWLKRGNTLILIDEVSNSKRLKLQDFGAKFLKDININGKVSIFEVEKGKLLFIDDANSYTNQGLKEIGPAVEFIGAIDLAGNKKVLFNEYFHGIGSRGITIFDLLGFNGMLVLIQLLLALVIFMLVKSRRFGKPEVVFEIIKRQENENLFALSNLYIKSRAYGLVLGTYLSFFKKELYRFLGYSHAPDEKELLAEIFNNRFLEKKELRSILLSCESFIEEGRKDGKQLLRLINMLEGIRKEIR